MKNVVNEDMSGNMSGDEMEDYKKIFLPLKNVIEAYGSDFSDYSSSSDDEEDDESSYTRPELIKTKKIIKKESSEQSSTQKEIEV